MALTIESGINIGGGISMGPNINPPTYPGLVMNLDAAEYSGSGPWLDSVNSLSFTLNNSPTYSASIGGGSFNFDTASSQYAESSVSLSSLTTWTVEAWHYYDDTNSEGSPCIVTEIFAGGTINYTLGNCSDSSPNVQVGYWDTTSFHPTPTGTVLTSGQWYQLVGTYDGFNNKLYINGTFISAGPNSSSVPQSSGVGIRLMRRWDAAQYWGGKLAIVRIYDGDIGASGVTSNWNANRARFGL